jgi:hypothetical protein
MDTDHELIGKVGNCTGSIEPGRMGEVMVPIRGGWESYFAYSMDGEDTIPEGCQILVLERKAPRTLIVSRY